MNEPLKNNYSKSYIRKVAQAVNQHHKDFNTERFTRQVINRHWPELELKDRMSHITRCLHRELDLPYSKAIPVLKKACLDFGGYEGMFFPEYVSCFGLQSPGTSIPALAHFTRFSSSEFAVRPFIETYPDIMFPQLETWSRHRNHHVRRLASEGCRPRLPWAATLRSLVEDPSPIFPVLHNLMQDESLYVRKSVANNLNDISKDHPEQVLVWARQYQHQHPLSDWIIKRGCRSLLRAGDPGALRLFGYPDALSTVASLKLDQKKLKIGNSLSMQLTASRLPRGPLRIEYEIEFARSAPGKKSRKKFHWLDREQDGSGLKGKKQHAFVQRSTRRLYPGTHIISIYINGKKKDSQAFQLEK
jgi:3-methyladenine DNA glycosylase AlkC